MRKTFLFLMLITLITLSSWFQDNGNKANQVTNNSLTEKEKAEGWELLFNGKDLNGWHSYLKTRPGAAWKVQNGMIVLVKDGKTPSADYADLTSDQEFEDFDLKLQWKLKPCTNSGIFFYVHEDPKYRSPSSTGPEMQVVDLACSPDSRILKSRAGDLYGLISCEEETVTPGGQWNQVEIISEKAHLQLFLNGTRVIDTHLWNDEWKSLIAASGKSKRWPDFGTFRKGRIAFQGTEPDTKIWFRNIKIRKL